MKPQTIRVFEHDHLKYNVPDNPEFDKDKWQALSDFNEKNQHKYFSITARGVRFKQYVGVVQVGKLTIEILPKIDRHLQSTSDNQELWHRVLLQMLKICKKLKSETLTSAELRLRKNSILDWYISIFLEEVDKLLRSGLAKKYRKEEDNLFTLKGQLMFNKQITYNNVHQERFFVRHTCYNRDNIFNQILNATLNIIDQISRSPSINSKLSLINLVFPEVSRVPINEKTFQNLRYDRMTERYKEAINIARMLLLHYSPDIRSGKNHVIALLFNMNQLWEEYITIQLRKACMEMDWNLLPQRKHTFWESKFYPRKKLQPDIIIIKAMDEGGDKQVRIAIDAKWKIPNSDGPSEDDLRQVFAYGQYFDSDEVYLLYPGRKIILNKGMFSKQKYFKSFFPETISGNILYVNVLNESDEQNPLNKEIGYEILKKIMN